MLYEVITGLDGMGDGGQQPVVGALCAQEVDGHGGGLARGQVPVRVVLGQAHAVVQPGGGHHDGRVGAFEIGQMARILDHPAHMGQVMCSYNFV